MGAFVIRIYLRLLDRPAKFHESHRTIKAPSPQGEAFWWVPFPNIALNHACFSHPTTPPWHADFNRRWLAKLGHRENIQGDGWRLRRSGHAEFSLPRGHSAAVLPSNSNPTSFYVTHRFFVSFLVRPALLPCGKRGFRAAICKIARPQPPAAAL